MENNTQEFEEGSKNSNRKDNQVIDWDVMDEMMPNQNTLQEMIGL